MQDSETGHCDKIWNVETEYHGIIFIIKLYEINQNELKINVEECFYIIFTIDLYML